ncbi:MAG: hypothetical protein ACRD2C_08750 [Acidimicrobiales bacterium]
MVDVSQTAAVVARCEGCELVVEVDALGALTGDRLGDCGECGSPVYVIDPSDDLYVAGFGAGWDACAAFMASVIDGEDPDDLVPPVADVVAAQASEPPMFCTGFVAGDPDGCARCGECAEAHDGVSGGV